MRQRNHALTLRLNDEELKHLKDQVVASGLTTQTFFAPVDRGTENQAPASGGFY